MPLILDSHQDIAWNMLTYGRDYTRSAHETRRLEAGTATPALNGDCTVGWPEYQRGQVAAVFATLFATPARKKETGDTVFYADTQTAHRLYRDQIDIYRRLQTLTRINFASSPQPKNLIRPSNTGRSLYWRGRGIRLG